MIKNLGKLKQWTGERLGGAKATFQTEDFQQLETETETRRSGFEKIQEATELFHTQLAKKKPSLIDSKLKCSPVDILGSCWVKHGTAFPEESNIGAALTSLGQVEGEISSLQDTFADALKNEYGNALEEGREEYKEYQNLSKKLKSRRLEYDANLSQLQKSKKEKPELEQALQSSRGKYEETEYDMIKKMEDLQRYEEEQHLNSLKKLLDAQISYYTKAMELLTDVRKKWDSELTNTPAAPASGLYNTQGQLSRQSSTPQLSSSSLHTPQRASSQTSIQGFQGSNSMSALGSAVTPDMPHRQVTNKREALYDFNGENNEELSFLEGNIITVTEFVAEGWSTGILNGHTGIFPTNYTKEYSVDSNYAPPISTNIPLQNVAEESPFHDNSEHTPSVAPPHASLARNHTWTPLPPSSNHRAVSTAPATPQAIPELNNYFQSSSSRTPCRECDCIEFDSHPFKKDSCKNCFHNH